MKMARGKVDLIKTSCLVFSAVLVQLVSFSESRPYSRLWYDYDYFPVAKPIQDAGTGEIVGTVNPLRPYEPWVLDCILVSTDKVEEGKRHPRCLIVDETNEKEYARFLKHVLQWEEAYPERAAKWNLRFPEAKEQERRKYERLKEFKDMHNLNLSEKEGDEPTQQTPCNNCTTDHDYHQQERTSEQEDFVDSEPPPDSESTESQ